MKKRFNFNVYVGIIALVLLLSINKINADITDFTQNDLNGTDIAYDANTPKSQQIVIVTDIGSIVIKLLPSYAPKSVDMFSGLVTDGYYNHTSFYRLVEQYFIQAGDPLENGIGDAEVKFPNEAKNLPFKEGTVALSNLGGDPEHTGSQFFITFVRSPWLDDKYNIIGDVVYGMNTLKSFSGKYNTNTQGIMQTPIPIRVYVLSELMRKFPNDNGKHIHPIAAKSNLVQEVLSQKTYQPTINPTDTLDIKVFAPSVTASPSFIDGVTGKLPVVGANSEKNSSNPLLNLLMKPHNNQ